MILAHAQTDTGGAAPKKLHLIQGEHRVSRDAGVSITTILGSCVAACMYDPSSGVGGMNHFLLAADNRGNDAAAARYGAYAMEVLINDLLKQGAVRSFLQAKLFGGAKMINGLADIGASNGAFARRFLQDEGIPIVSDSLGGLQARRVEFWPASGRVRQRFVDGGIAEAPRPTPVADDGDVELF